MNNQADRGAGTEGPPQALADWWARNGAVPDGAEWRAFSGGRTNALWHVVAPGENGSGHVCKLYREGAHTPLFDNDAEAEHLALRALEGTGLAPGLVAWGETPLGPSIVYAHASGRPWRDGDDSAPVARALARLHAQTPPTGLPRAGSGGAWLRQQTEAMIADLGSEGAALLRLQPEAADPGPAAAPVFLHGDATAGNVLVNGDQVTLIDWQCPCLGDPTDDLATFLSPAMQAMSGNTPLGPEAEEAFLRAYGNDAVAARYRALAPHYHWRMAAYCLWRAARGDRGYAEAAAHELARFTTG